MKTLHNYINEAYGTNVDITDAFVCGTGDGMKSNRMMITKDGEKLYSYDVLLGQFDTDYQIYVNTDKYSTTTSRHTTHLINAIKKNSGDRDTYVPVTDVPDHCNDLVKLMDERVYTFFDGEGDYDTIVNVDGTVLAQRIIDPETYTYTYYINDTDYRKMGNPKDTMGVRGLQELVRSTCEGNLEIDRYERATGVPMRKKSIKLQKHVKEA